MIRNQIRRIFIVSLLAALSTCGASPSFDRSLAAKTNNGTSKDKTIMFSVLLNPAANIKAADLKPISTNDDNLSSKASDLYTSVIDVTRKVLCQETNFEMIVNGTDSCRTSSTANTENIATTNTTKLEASFNQIGVVVQDGSPDTSSWGLQEAIPWLEFTIHYPVLQTTTTNKNTYKIAQKAIRTSINDNTFANQLQAANLNNDIMAVANVGDENQVFSPWAQLWESLVVASVDNTTTATTPPSTVTAISLDQSSAIQQFFYPIRIVGLVLLFITILFVSFMFVLAQRRKKEREQEEEELRRGTTTALRTNDGLNAMLEVGREVTLRRRMNPVT